MARVMVAMSGGVDSSVVAALLHRAGHDVTGVTMHVWEVDSDKMVESRCCSMAAEVICPMPAMSRSSNRC
jgi:tRNA-specific 2-thiouridylase